MTIHCSIKGLAPTDELERYARRRVNRLRRSLPRKLRADADCQVILTRTTHAGVKQNTCTIVFVVNGGNASFSATESTQHIHAALDIVVVRIERELKLYTHGRRRGFFRIVRD
ncbi:MAG TPA: HPF/RaiA family ribosome-associated protein [Verrucomicrobiae bacterium]|nr:HPF/RaiA family ribosome-associated protein [Verrucomicrobiae bacterium]